MNIIDCTQGTPEWHAARCGKVTGSRVADIVRKTKSGVSASRKTYAGELVAERLSGFQASSSFSTRATEWGKEQESAAREMYGFITDAKVIEVGFVDHIAIEWFGVSPDGLVGEDGLVSFKCPNSSTHIDTLQGAPIDPDYVKQMLAEMACTGRQWCDFVSFDPRMPADMQIDIRRVHRESVVIAELEIEVRKFLAEVDETVAGLIKRFRTPIAAE